MSSGQGSGQGQQYRPETLGGTTGDRIARPKIEPGTPFERSAAFAGYGSRFDPDPDSPEDLYTKAVIAEQGFDGRPHVVSARELDRYVSTGEIEVFRGVADARHAEQYLHGDLFVGRGTFGSGTYSAAGSRGRAHARVFAAEEGGVVLRLTLKRGARIANYDDLLRIAGEQRQLTIIRLRAHQPRAVRQAFERGGRPEANRMEAEYETRVAAAYAECTNVGRYAAFHGYDAIGVKAYDYYVVLNRTAVRVQREDER